MKQNSDIRRVRGTRLTRAFKADLSYEYRSPTYGKMTRSGPFSNTFGFLMVLLAVRPQSPRSVRGPRRRLPPRGHISSDDDDDLSNHLQRVLATFKRAS